MIMKRIVFTSYINSSQYTDPEAWLKRIEGYREILEVLAKRHEVHSIEQINYQGYLHHNQVHYHFLNFKKNTIFPNQLHNYIRKLEPEIVLVHGFVFPLQIIQLKSFLGSKTRIIVQNHAEKPLLGWRKQLQRNADSFVDAYLFTSVEMGNEWVHKKIISTRNKIREVMEASSSFAPIEKEIAQQITKTEGNPVFLWVGRLDANKDPLTVIKAFIEFVSCQPSSRLYMIYHTEELLEEARFLICSDEKARKNIFLIGQIPHQQMQNWYNSADFIISGSHYEGSGVAVCEAMSCGCIPIVTNIASFRKMTGRGKCGFLYEPGNETELLSLLLATTELNIEKEKMKVLEQFRQELSFAAIASKINQVIDPIETNV